MALREDHALVQGVMEHRMALAAAELLKDRKRGSKVLSENPRMVDLLIEMRRAQTGETITRDQLLASIGTDGEDQEDA